jgi:hypothetical protein
MLVLSHVLTPHLEHIFHFLAKMKLLTVVAGFLFVATTLAKKPKPRVYSCAPFIWR